jgi:UDP-N-acetylmuramate dehydrogenase
MKIIQDVNLADHSTMGLGGKASYLSEVSSKDELKEVIDWAKQNSLEIITIGSGSNIIWRDEGFKGLVIVNKIAGFSIDKDGDRYYVSIGAGENWDDVVERCASKSLSGIEALSLIPGSAGATPVQNVGAYGQEIADTLVSLEAYDTKTDQFVTILSHDCGFSYRKSRFNSKDKGRYIIIGIKLCLAKTSFSPPFYETLEKYLEAHNINNYTPLNIRKAVIAIRSSRLPDVNKVHNTGSFFGNPIISEQQLIDLQDKYGDIPSWPVGEGQVKLAAAWLIQELGFKDYHDAKTGMSTWLHQPLVLVNEHAKTTADLLEFKAEIVEAVENRFNVTLKQEPEMLP